MTGDQSARDCGVSITSSVDVSSATLISVHSGVKSASVELDSSCVIHPFHVHKMDSGPVRLMTIAHAFNYRVAVLRDGAKSALRVGRSRKAEKVFFDKCKYPMGATGGSDVSNCFNTDGRSTGIRINNDGITRHATACTAYERSLGT